MPGQPSSGRRRPLIALIALILLLLAGYLGRALGHDGEHHTPAPRPSISDSARVAGHQGPRQA